MFAAITIRRETHRREELIGALDFAAQLMDVVDASDRAALDRAIRRLTQRSAQLTADLAKAPMRR